MGTAQQGRALAHSCVYNVPSNNVRLSNFLTTRTALSGPNGHETRRGDEPTTVVQVRRPTTEDRVLCFTKCLHGNRLKHDHITWHLRKSTAPQTMKHDGRHSYTKNHSIQPNTFGISTQAFLWEPDHGYEIGVARPEQPWLWTVHSTTGPGLGQYHNDGRPLLLRALADGHARRTLQLARSHNSCLMQ